MIVNGKPRRSFTNPNIVAMADRLNSRSRSPRHPWFSHLPAAADLSRTTSISTRPSYVAPTKTIVFTSQESVSAYYNIESVRPPAPVLDVDFEISFTNPLPGEIDSALTIAFVCSRYSFCAALLNEVNPNLSDISKTYRCLQLLNPDSESVKWDAFEKVEQFMAFLQFLNLSISGPKKVRSLEELQTHAQELFSGALVEDIVFAIPADLIPPNVVVVRSRGVAQATEGGATLELKYVAHWGIALRLGHFLPIIVHSNGEVDALYHCVTNNHFGSMQSLVYADIPIEFICYSLRPHNCPRIAIN
jgi:hypothetical protein